MMNKTRLPPAERDRLARLFAQIASEAGVAVMEVYATDFETRTKADSSPVSDADERAEEIILKRLAEALPGVGGAGRGGMRPRRHWRGARGDVSCWSIRWTGPRSS